MREFGWVLEDRGARHLKFDEIRSTNACRSVDSYIPQVSYEESRTLFTSSLLGSFSLSMSVILSIRILLMEM
jgi:hypothetical protein